MIQLLMLFGISMAVSFSIAVIGVGTEETSAKFKERQFGKSFYSWLFLYPLFERFSHWLEHARVTVMRAGGTLLTFLRVTIAIFILTAIGHIVYILIKLFFS